LLEGGICLQKEHPMNYEVELTEEALANLAKILDRRVREALFARIRKLAEEPEKQGKPLVDELAGYRSVRAVGQRYRIVYEVQNDVVKVIVVGVGIRKEGHRTDVYARLNKLFGKE
jgi:mRNA interferase RelE/StbE